MLVYMYSILFLLHPWGELAWCLLNTLWEELDVNHVSALAKTVNEAILLSNCAHTKWVTMLWSLSNIITQEQKDKWMSTWQGHLTKKLTPLHSSDFSNYYLHQDISLLLMKCYNWKKKGNQICSQIVVTLSISFCSIEPDMQHPRQTSWWEWGGFYSRTAGSAQLSWR